MTTHAKAHHDRRTAALHTSNGEARLLVLAKEGSALRVESAQSFAASDTSAIKAALDRAGEAHLVRVIPGAGAITRVVSVPSGDEHDIAAALDLIAEAELPAAIPAHRRAAGIIPSAHANGTVSALILGWPAASTIDPFTDDDRFTTETASLNALLAQTPGDSAAYIDAKAGSISLFATSGETHTVRSIRENPAERDHWRDTVARVHDTLDLPAPTADRALLINEAAALRITERVKGARADQNWLDKYAIPLGAALGASSDTASIASLFALTPEAEKLDESLYTTLRNRIANPHTATLLLIIFLAVALLAPFAGAFLRYQILVARTGGLEEQRAAEQAIDQQTELYEELEARTWPVAKLLANLSGAIAPGITAESVQIINSGGDIQVVGTAESADLLNQMQQTIASSGVFADPTLPRIERSSSNTGGPIEFTLIARVIRPYANPRNTEDYAEQSLAVRLYGEEAVARYPDDITALVSPEPDTVSTARRIDGTSAPSESAESGDGPSGLTRTRARANERETQTLPEPLTDDAIASMDRAALMKEFGLRRKATSYPELDPEDEARLKSEVQKIRDRLSELRGS